MAAKKRVKRGQEDRVRVDVIDHEHNDWPKVFAVLAKRGADGDLMMRDGYLSARQSLLIARSGKTVVGHLCFHVEPGGAQGAGIRSTVDAHLDAIGVLPGFDQAEVARLLVFAAQKRASILRCKRLFGFEGRTVKAKRAEGQSQLAL